MGKRKVVSSSKPENSGRRRRPNTEQVFGSANSLELLINAAQVIESRGHTEICDPGVSCPTPPVLPAAPLLPTRIASSRSIEASVSRTSHFTTPLAASRTRFTGNSQASSTQRFTSQNALRPPRGIFTVIEPPLQTRRGSTQMVPAVDYPCMMLQILSALQTAPSGLRCIQSSGILAPRGEMLFQFGVTIEETPTLLQSPRGGMPLVLAMGQAAPERTLLFRPSSMLPQATEHIIRPSFQPLPNGPLITQSLESITEDEENTNE